MRSKKAQGVFGMSFTMIFTILVIIFLLVVAFMAIRAFINYQECAHIGLFLQEFQDDIDDAWNSQSIEFDFNSSLPSKIKYVCIVNQSAPIIDALAIEREVYAHIERSGMSRTINLVFWPVEEACSLGYEKLKHFKYPEKNPHCFPVENGRVNIRISKSFEEALPRIS